MILPYGREWCVHKLTLGLRTGAECAVQCADSSPGNSQIMTTDMAT
jgi:hypothetical protein